jgi:hypothetical protein
MRYEGLRRLKNKGLPSARSSRYIGSGEGSYHFGSYVRSLSMHFCKRLFPGLELMTSWSWKTEEYCNNFKAPPDVEALSSQGILLTARPCR